MKFVEKIISAMQRIADAVEKIASDGVTVKYKLICNRCARQNVCDECGGEWPEPKESGA